MLDFFSQHVPHSIALLLTAFLSALLIVSFLSVAALLYIWAERKVSARMQDRLGPTRTGPFGLLQSLADGIKLITKEDTTPDVADRFLFRIAPYLAFCAAFCGYLALPFGLGLVPQNLSIAAFFMLAILSSEVFGVLLAGYASGSKWSMFGGLREAAQVVSYEVPRSMCVVVPVCVVGTLNLTEMANQQTGAFWNWTIFHDPFTFVAFFIFFITATASCKRAPFDLAEAESELVAGFHTEYSGLRWSFFFLAEYGSMFAVSGLAAFLYLGGWHTGVLPFEPAERFGIYWGNLLNATVFIGKGTLLVLVMMWMRWSLPRLRIDQVMMTCLKYFLPVSCALLVGVCAWQIYAARYAGEVTRYVLAFGSLAFLLFVGLGSLRLRGGAARGELAGVWAKG